MTMNTLKWIAIIAPAAFVGLFEFVRHEYFHERVPSVLGNLITMAIALAFTGLFAHFIFANVRKLQEKIIHQNQHLSTVNAITNDINRTLDLETILNNSLEQLGGLFDLKYSGIYLKDAQGQPFLAHHKGLSPVALKGLTAPVAAPLYPLCGCSQAMDNKAPVLILEAQQDPRCSAVLIDEVLPYTCASFPLKSRGEIMGAMFFIKKSGAPGFSPSDMDLLEAISHQMGSAIENARLHQQIAEVSVMEERDRLARELHDGLAQVMGYLTLKTATTRDHLERHQEHQALEEIKEMGEVAEQAYKDTREAILGLRTSVSPEEGLIRSLREYLHKFDRQSGIKTELVVARGAVIQFTPKAEVQLIRIIQEALTNVRRHSGARHAWVRMERDKGKVKITVEDDGHGFDPAAVTQSKDGRVFGLQTMRERTESIGGSFQIQSAPGRATRVVVSLPEKG